MQLLLVTIILNSRPKKGLVRMIRGFFLVKEVAPAQQMALQLWNATEKIQMVHSLVRVSHRVPQGSILLSKIEQSMETCHDAHHTQELVLPEASAPSVCSNSTSNSDEIRGDQVQILKYKLSNCLYW